MIDFAFVRIYRKDGYCPDIVAHIKEVLKTGLIKHIIPIVSMSLDKKNTAREIEKEFSKDTRVSVLPLENFKKPTDWALSLNEGLDFISEEFEIVYDSKLLIFSNEVSFTRETLEAMEEAMVPGVCAVGVLFPGFIKASYRKEKLARNTFILWSSRALLESGGFDEKCDLLGGMEDYHKERELEILYRLKTKVIDAPGVKLTVASVTNQSEKEEREIAAMAAIDQILEGKRKKK